MRSTLLIVVAITTRSVALPAQRDNSDDSASLARAIATYVVAHPVGAGGSHGPVRNLVIAPSSRRWNFLVSSEVHDIAPTLWMDERDPHAWDEPHVDIRTIADRGDSVVVSAAWTWCFPVGGGESGWPVAYTVVRAEPAWSVRSGDVLLVGHAPKCSLREGEDR